MADENFTITIWPTTVTLANEAVVLWHWKRLNENGGQVDGSGAQRNGLESKKAARDVVRERYPDDKITS